MSKTLISLSKITQFLLEGSPRYKYKMPNSHSSSLQLQTRAKWELEGATDTGRQSSPSPSQGRLTFVCLLLSDNYYSRRYLPQLIHLKKVTIILNEIFIYLNLQQCGRAFIMEV